MERWWSLVREDFVLFLRRPPGNFFSLVMPVLALLGTGWVFGNAPTGAGGYGALDRTIPGQLAGVIGATGLLVTPELLAARRGLAGLGWAPGERLERVRLLSVPLLVAFFVAFLGAALVLALGTLVFGMRAPLAAGAVALAFVLCCAAFLALGAFVGALFPTPAVARIVELVFFLLNLFLSGSAMPPDQLPAPLQRLGLLLPLTHVRLLLDGVWLGDGWDGRALAVVGLMLPVAAALAVLARRRWPVAVASA